MEPQALAPQSVVRLRRVNADRDQRRRLAELGFVPGRTIRVLGRGACGGAVLALGDARVAVDSEVCRCLQVTPLGSTEQVTQRGSTEPVTPLGTTFSRPVPVPISQT